MVKYSLSICAVGDAQRHCYMLTNTIITIISTVFVQVPPPLEGDARSGWNVFLHDRIIFVTYIYIHTMLYQGKQIYVFVAQPLMKRGY